MDLQTLENIFAKALFPALYPTYFLLWFLIWGRRSYIASIIAEWFAIVLTIITVILVAYMVFGGDAWGGVTGAAVTIVFLPQALILFFLARRSKRIAS